MASDEWIHELTSHPYISSKIRILILIEKPGKAIYTDEAEEQVSQSKERNKEASSVRINLRYQERFRMGKERRRGKLTEKENKLVFGRRTRPKED